MITLPLVALLALVAFGLVMWGDEKISGILVGVVLGLALATTPLGPPILHAVKVASETVLTAISAAVQ